MRQGTWSKRRLRQSSKSGGTGMGTGCRIRYARSWLSAPHIRLSERKKLDVPVRQQLQTLRIRPCSFLSPGATCSSHLRVSIASSMCVGVLTCVCDGAHTRLIGCDAWWRCSQRSRRGADSPEKQGAAVPSASAVAGLPSSAVGALPGTSVKRRQQMHAASWWLQHVKNEKHARQAMWEVAHRAER